MDNINIYKGKRKHLIIFKELTPSMLNFTGQAIIIPFLSEEVKSQMKSKEHMSQNQKDVLKLNASDILYSAKSEDGALFEKYKDYYILSAMEKAYNGLPTAKKNVSDMNEAEFNAWISSSDFSKPKKRYKLHVPQLEEIIDMTHSSRKTTTYVLPLSLEDNATIAGTSAILQQFETEFGLYSSLKSPEFLPYDTLKKYFDVDTARSRYECMASHSKHTCDMANFTDNLNSKEKQLDNAILDDISEQDTGSESETEYETLEEHSDGQTSEAGSAVTRNINCTLDNERRRFMKEDESFWQMYNSVAARVYTALLANSEEHYIQTINEMAMENLDIYRDHLKRSFLHITIDKGNNQVAKALIFSGFNINMRSLMIWHV